MKTITTALFFLAASVLSHIQDAAIGQRIQKRGDLLSRIHEMTEEQSQGGAAQKKDAITHAL